MKSIRIILLIVAVFIGSIQVLLPNVVTNDFKLVASQWQFQISPCGRNDESLKTIGEIRGKGGEAALTLPYFTCKGKVIPTVGRNLFLYSITTFEDRTSIHANPVHPHSKPSRSDAVSWPAKNKKGKDSLCWNINIGDTTLRLIDSEKNIFKIPEIQTSASNYKDFVPKNWKILNVVSSDLNHDNLEDVAIIIGSNNLYWCPFDSSCKIAPKILLIAFKQKDSSFHLFKKYTDWVLDFCQGVQHNEPFLDLICQESSIYISFYRGGTEIVFCTYQFKFQTDDFYLVWANCIDQWRPEAKDGLNLETDMDYTTGEGRRHSERPKKNKKYETFRFNNQQIIKLDHFRPFSDDTDPLVINHILP